MSLRPDDATISLFRALASSSASYDELEGCFRRMLDNEREVLTNIAVGSLTRPELVAQAQVQLGRVELLDELISFLGRFKHKERKL